ncbi:MAG: hypothetical protein ACYCZ7_01665 [Minisyncoccota bacterium]
MTVNPLKRHYGSISGANIEEFCQWYRAGKIDIAQINFEAEDITVTIGLESEVRMLEEALSIAYLPSRDARLEKIIKELAG